jgi:hypothetical protein
MPGTMAKRRLAWRGCSGVRVGDEQGDVLELHELLRVKFSTTKKNQKRKKKHFQSATVASLWPPVTLLMWVANILGCKTPGDPFVKRGFWLEIVSID